MNVFQNWCDLVTLKSLSTYPFIFELLLGSFVWNNLREATSGRFRISSLFRPRIGAQEAQLLEKKLFAKKNIEAQLRSRKLELLETPSALARHG